MARQLRIEYAGAIYHITSRGNAQEAIYRNDEDRTEFLSLLNTTCNRFNPSLLLYRTGPIDHLFDVTPSGIIIIDASIPNIKLNSSKIPKNP